MGHFRVQTFWLVAGVVLLSSGVSRAGEELPYFALSGVVPDILIMLDTSSSMRAEVADTGRTRADIAAEIVVEMVGANPEARWGLVRTPNPYLDGGYEACMVGTADIELGQYAKGSVTTDAFKDILAQYIASDLAFRGSKNLEGGLVAAYDEWQRSIEEDENQACRKKAMIIITGGGVDPWDDCLSTDAIDLIMDIYNSAPSAGGLLDIETYVIGFNLEEDTSVDILDDMAEAGQGLNPAVQSSDDVFPYSANSISDFYAALSYILNDIIYGAYTNSFPVLYMSYESANMYQAYFEILPNNQALAWYGHIIDYELDTAGGAILAERMDVADVLNDDSYASRNIYTAVDVGGGAGDDTLERLEFSPANAGALYDLLALDEWQDVDCDFNPATEGDAEALIRFILGDTSVYYADCYTPRDNWKLLDIFRSTPRLVTPANAPSTDTDYFAFQELNAERPDMLIAGSNGGMLHAFRVAENLDGERVSSDGKELWGYIPKHLLPKLRYLWDMFPHPIYVDATASVRDVKMRSPYDVSDHAEWHTVAVFGNGIIGDETACGADDPPTYKCGFYTALDISRLEGSQYTIDPLWEFSGDKDIIVSAAEPTFANIRVDDGGGNRIAKAVLLPGKGRSFDAMPASPIYIVDLEMQQGSDAIGKVTLPWKNADPEINRGIRGRVLAVDTTDDMLEDRIYVGDKEGRFWRVDISSSSPDDWQELDSLQVLFDPDDWGEPTLPISYPPTYVYDVDGSIVVYFGTGDPSTAYSGMPGGRFYALIDDKKLGNFEVFDDGNWPIEFDENEVLAGDPIVAHGVLYFTTYYPSLDSNCYLGNGRLYAVDWRTAEGRVNRDEETGEFDAETKFVELGPGIPSGVVLGYDRWYVAMNNSSIGDANASETALKSEEGWNSNQFVGKLRPYAWIEVSGR